MTDLASHATDRRVAEFDGLRGVAISLVLWHHLVAGALPTGIASWLGWLRAATNLAWSGVDLFFVLSGFFIGGILIQQRDSPRLARVFYLRRAARILPLYFLTLTLLLTLGATGAPGAWHRFPAWVYGLFLTNIGLASAQLWDWLPLSVLWSIAVEEQFYLAAPWIVRNVSPTRLPWLLGALALLAWALRLGVLAWFPEGHFAVQVLTPLRMDLLALGALVAWMVRAPAAQYFRAALAASWRPWLAVGVAAVAALGLQRAHGGDRVFCLYGYTLLAVFFALLVAVVASVRPATLNHLLRVRWLAHLGRHSYFVYLWHGFLAAGLIRWLGGPAFVLNSVSTLGVVVLAVAATWVAAALSWKFFEQPFVAWGQRQRY